MRDRENTILQELEQEEIKEVIDLLKERNMSIEELKNMITGDSIESTESEKKQSALFFLNVDTNICS